MTTVALLGAGSVEFTHRLLVNLIRTLGLEALDLRLHDVDEDRLATATVLARRLVDDTGTGSAGRVSSSRDRRRSLDGADFVINSIQAGGMEATRTDFEVPARYGLRQTIGDTLGVGGIFRALRTAPILAAVARDMAAVCPDAWLLNHTNPMAANVWYLSEIAPRLKVLGLCHSVHWTVIGLCELVGVPVQEVTHLTAGVNHQAWLLTWEHAGRSLYPALDRRIRHDPQLRRRARVDMYLRLGYYPTETSEHSAEYVPWYLPHEEEVARLRIHPGAYLNTSAANMARYAALKRTVARGGTPPLEPDDAEYAPQVVGCMASGRSRRIVATVINRGLISNLPSQASVEVPCVVDGEGAHPVAVGAIPPQCAALNRNYLNVVELTVRAAIDGDARAVRHAAMLDPNTAATLTVKEIWALCDDLVTAHRDRLPEPLRGRLRPASTSG